MNDSVKSAVRALECLEVLATAAEGVTLVELARVLNAPKSSVLMLLRTLVDRAYVERDAHDRYVINPALKGHELGWIGGPQSVLVRSAYPVMRELTAGIRETSFVAVMSGDMHLRLLAKVVSPREIRYDTDLSRLSIPHKTASGRIQLAHWPEDQLATYAAAWTHKRVPEADRLDETLLRDQLAAARAEGAALLIDEWVAGATGVSAPVFDGDGLPIAAVTIGAVTARFLADRAEIVAAVKAAGRQITETLPSGLRQARRSRPSAAPARARRTTRGETHAVS